MNRIVNIRQIVDRDLLHMIYWIGLFIYTACQLKRKMVIVAAVLTFKRQFTVGRAAGRGVRLTAGRCIVAVTMPLAAR
jgi:hypothetical protein